MTFVNKSFISGLFFFSVRGSLLHPEVRQQEGDAGGDSPSSRAFRPRPLLLHRLREGEGGMQQVEVGIGEDRVRF